MASYLTFKIDDVKVSVPYYDYVHEEEGVTPEIMIDHVYRKNKFHSCYMDSLNRLKEAQAPWSEERLKCLAFSLTLYDLLTLPGCKKVHRSLGSSNPVLSNHERQVFEIMMSYLKDKPSYMMSYFYEHNIFPALLYKEGKAGIDCLSLFNDSIKDNPKAFLEMAMASFDKRAQFPEDLNKRLDYWLAQRLSNINFKKQVSNKEFVQDINSYLKYSTPNVSDVCRIVCQKIDAFDDSEQGFIWHQILFGNTSGKRVFEAVKGYLSVEHNEKTNKIFYNYIHNLPLKMKSQILGEATESAQRNYLRILKQQNANPAKIQVEDSETQKTNYLMWHLYDKDKLPDKELIQSIQNEKLDQRQKPARQSFLFRDKSKFDRDIFKTGCQKVKDSTFGSLMWINSFSKTSNFDSNLAALWPELPLQIRKNKNIQLSCDNHFDLFYHLAEDGNTSSLNEIKQTMKDEYPEFIRRLMREHQDGDTCLHLLCRQGKKGVLNLLKELPKEKQSELLKQPNDMGQSSLDICSADFRRFLDQKNFIRPISEAQRMVSEAISEKEKAVAQQNTPSVVEQKQILHPHLCSKRFDSDKEKLGRDEALANEINKEVLKLRKMPLQDLQARIKQDMRRNLKSRMSVTNFRFADITYRMGYLFQSGTIAFLFVTPHHQYEKELHPLGYLDKMAISMRKQISAQVAAQRNGGRQ